MYSENGCSCIAAFIEVKRQAIITYVLSNPLVVAGCK